jgi:hypothetical protein
MNVYKSELYRYGLADCLAAVERKTVICSMLQTREIVKAPSKNGWTKTKPPSLLELYRFATGKPEMANAHNSLYDVINLHEAVKALVLKKQLSLLIKLLKSVKANLLVYMKVIQCYESRASSGVMLRGMERRFHASKQIHSNKFWKNLLHRTPRPLELLGNLKFAMGNMDLICLNIKSQELHESS